MAPTPPSLFSIFGVSNASSWFAPFVYVFLGSITAIISIWGNADITADRLRASFGTGTDTFDFIVG